MIADRRGKCDPCLHERRHCGCFPALIQKVFYLEGEQGMGMASTEDYRCHAHESERPVFRRRRMLIGSLRAAVVKTKS